MYLVCINLFETPNKEYVSMSGQGFMGHPVKPAVPESSSANLPNSLILPLNSFLYPSLQGFP